MVCERWLNVGAAALLSVAFSGCSFDSNANGGSGGSDETESDGSGSTTATSSTMSASGATQTTNPSDPSSTNDPSDPTSTNDPSDPTGTSDPTGSSSGDPPVDVAELQLSEGFDFGLVNVDGTADHVFTLENVGVATATAVTPFVMPAPFAIVGTTCGATLEPSASCEITVTFAPISLGPFEGELAVAYNDGAAEQGVDRELDGGGAGETRNLIENPGAETCSAGAAPPDNWIEEVGSNWTCINTFGGELPHGGVTMFFPGAADSGTFPDLRQTVTVPDELGKLVMDGTIGMRFSGWALSNSGGDDPRRFRLAFIDGGGATLGTWDSGWESGTSWEQETDSRVPDSTMTSIDVHLDCDIEVSSNCSALFDDLELHFFYPPT